MRRAVLVVLLLASACSRVLGDDGSEEEDLSVPPTILQVPSTSTTTTTTTTTAALPDGPSIVLIAAPAELPTRANQAVLVRGFDGGETVAIGQCRREGALEDPLNHCQLGTTVVLEADGRATATVEISRYISVGGVAVDCRVTDCLIGATVLDPANPSAALGLQPRAITSLTFADEPPAPLFLALSAQPPYADGQSLTLTAEPNDGVGFALTQVCKLTALDECTKSPSFFGPFTADRMQFFPEDGFLDCGVIGCVLRVSTTAGQEALASLQWIGAAPPPVVVTADVPFQYIEGTSITFRVDGAAHLTGIHLRVDHPDGFWNQPVSWPSRGDPTIPFIDDDTIEFDFALVSGESGLYDDCIAVGCDFSIGVGEDTLASFPFVLVPLE